MTMVYKIVPEASWREAARAGRFEGAPVDLADGFIHLSAARQVAETARRHFRDQAGLLLVGFREETLAPALSWEPSRGGDLFPHLFGPLDPALACYEAPLPLDGEGVPQIPADLPA